MVCDVILAGGGGQENKVENNRVTFPPPPPPWFHTFYCKFVRAEENRFSYRGLRYMEVLQIEVPLYYQESIDSENTSIFLRQHSIPTLRFKLDQPVIYIS